MIRDMAAAKSAELRQEHTLLMDDNEEALEIEEEMDKRVELLVPSANRSKSLSQEEVDSSSPRQDADDNSLNIMHELGRCRGINRGLLFRPWPTIEIRRTSAHVRENFIATQNCRKRCSRN